MPNYHKVAQGECLATIAADYGFTDYHAIYDHPKNVIFKKKRSNPDILFPGDCLYIPDKQGKQDNRNTTARHCYQVASATKVIRLVVEDLTNKPMANVPYRLTHEQGMLTGNTDGRGF